MIGRIVLTALAAIIVGGPPWTKPAVAAGPVSAGPVSAGPVSAGPVSAGLVSARGTQFVLDGAPFYVTGVNNHYLPWGSEAEVTRVLDDAVAMGANVVRTFLQPVIGSLDGTTMPTTWNFHNDRADSADLNVHGNYLLYWDPTTHAMAINASANGMRKIDFLIAEAAKRHLKLIISFLDFWPYTGGSQQISAWHGGESSGRNPFFFEDPRPMDDYKALLKFVVQRANPLTGIVYRDDPAVFAWELMNEPEAALPLRLSWMTTMSAYVKSLDPKHLVASGEDHLDIADFRVPTLDLVTWHGYPKYYGISPARFDALIRENCALAKRFGKPVLLEEFGYARSNRDPDQAQAYETWLKTMRDDPDCAGWLVWRLVSLQDRGQYPADAYDQFDVHNDGGDTWRVLRQAVRQNRSR